MPIKYTSKWKNAFFDDIIDVRTPAEYNEDHIPGSINLPVLNNKQRIIIGTIYKKDNRVIALISDNLCCTDYILSILDQQGVNVFRVLRYINNSSSPYVVVLSDSSS